MIALVVRAVRSGLIRREAIVRSARMVRPGSRIAGHRGIVRSGLIVPHAVATVRRPAIVRSARIAPRGSRTAGRRAIVRSAPTVPRAVVIGRTVGTARIAGTRPSVVAVRIVDGRAVLAAEAARADANSGRAMALRPAATAMPSDANAS